MNDNKNEVIIDESAYAAAKKYVENLMEYNELDRTKYNADLSEEELINQLIEVSMKKRKIQVENNTFINEYVVPFEKNFCQMDAKVNDFYIYLCTILRDLSTSQYYDRGLNARVIRLRNKYYEEIKDYASYLHSLYYILYFSMIFCDHSGGHTIIEGHDKLENINEEFFKVKYEETRFNLSDCLLAIVYNPLDKKGCIQRFDFAINTIKSYAPEFLIPGHNRYSSFQYAIVDTVNHYIEAYKEATDSFTKEDIEFGVKLEKMLTAEVEERKINVQQENGIVSLYELRYIIGTYSIEQLLELLLQEYNSNIDGPQIMNATRIRIAALYIQDLWLFSGYDKLKKIELSNDFHRKAIQTYEKLKKLDDSYFNVIYLSEYVVNCAKYMGFDKMGEQVLQVTVKADKNLFIHTKMVRLLSLIILDKLLEINPEYFEGVAGYDKNFIIKHPLVIKDLMSQCALYHDIGKFFCLDYVSNSSRNLTDDEFIAIKYHPENFDMFFSNEDDEEFLCIRDCARLHHLWHNGQGGYPQNRSHTYNLPMVDILSIADSIDAATDIIGRPYTSGKTLDELIAEFDTFRDTRYSSYIIDILKYEDVKQRIQYTITTERKNINYEIMRS